MADIQVVIKLREGEDGTLTSLGSTSEVSNASIQRAGNDVFTKMSEKNDGKNLKSWAKGYLSLADGYVGGADTKLIEQYGYNGYVFGATDSNGILNVTMQIYGTDLSGIIIYGDKQANQFPTEAYLDGDENNKIYNSDLIWTITFDEPANYKEITFTKWNRAEYNACLTSVQKLSVELVFDKSNIKTLESLSQSTGQPNNIFYGVVPNSGSMEIIDKRNELLDMVRTRMLPVSKVPLTILANTKDVQKHLTSDVDYQSQQHLVTIGITNDLEEWDNIQYDGYPYSAGEKTAYTLLFHCLTSCGYSNADATRMLSKIKDILESTIIPVAYLQQDSLRNTVNKFCELCQLVVYKDSNGDVVFANARPIFQETEPIIAIPANRQLSAFDSSVIKKNQYSKVTINESSANFQVSDIYESDEITFQKQTGGWYLPQSSNANYYMQTEDAEKVETDGTYSPQGSWLVLEYNLDISKLGNNFDKTNIENLAVRVEQQIVQTPYTKSNFGQANVSGSFDTSLNKQIDKEELPTQYGTMTQNPVMTLNGNILNIKFSVRFRAYFDGASGVFEQNSFTFFETKSLKFFITAPTISFQEKSQTFNSENLGQEIVLHSNEMLQTETTTKVVDEYKYHIEDGIGGTTVGEVDFYDPRLSNLYQSYTYDETTGYITGHYPITLSTSGTTPLAYYIYNEKEVLLPNGKYRYSGRVLRLENTRFVTTFFRTDWGYDWCELIEVSHNEPISQVIANNIISDYADGIATAKTTIVCSDYYDINGELLKTWANGDILNVGDLVRVDKNNSGSSIATDANGQPTIWRVTGRRFRYSGVPVVDLELQEAKQSTLG